MPGSHQLAGAISRGEHRRGIASLFWDAGLAEHALHCATVRGVARGFPQMDTPAVQATEELEMDAAEPTTVAGISLQSSPLCAMSCPHLECPACCMSGKGRREASAVTCWGVIDGECACACL